jgi:serine/threonine protein kinase
MHVLKGPHPFILNAHGIAEDASSWVLTSSDLKWLLFHEPYLDFIRTCICSNTILFVGVTAEDISVGGHLEQLARLGVDSGTHYWITNRQSVDLDRWAESVGIKVIRYASGPDEHAPLAELFEDLLEYVPKEDTTPPPPVVPPEGSPPAPAIPSLDDLVLEDAETIRQYLNAEARQLLQAGATEEYDAFCKEYDEAIYRAWYATTQPGKNTLLGYALKKEVARGAFGRVFMAEAPSGEQVAVKVLLETIRDDCDLLQAFRRGVRSMRILSSHSVEGMVPYREASEIPAMAVMDWVDGPDLGAAIMAAFVTDWPDILKIGVDLSKVVRSAHLLPERVLHRDLRPSNIMLEGYYSDNQAWRVVVLDFDLSWHRGATEKSVIYGSTRYGYLAPEQIEKTPGVSTRHASVDSFGLGMTLYFMASRRDPLPDEHKHTGWRATVLEACNSHPCKEWLTAPARFARVILNSTEHNQALRWDMAQIQRELERLHEAVTSPSTVRSAELIAEESALRTDIAADYSWDSNTLSAVKDFPTGIRVSLRGDESLGKLILDLSWNTTGVHDWRRVGKWIPPATKTANEILTSAGWEIHTCEALTNSMALKATLDTSHAARRLDQIAESIDKATAGLRFT